MIKKTVPLLFLLGLLACQSMDDSLLHGAWQADELLEEDKAVAVDTDEIIFEFKADNTYSFSSTLNYREAGAYALDGRLLYTTDTLNETSDEKAVEVVLLTQDSLHLRMQENGKERLLKLIKTN